MQGGGGGCGGGGTNVESLRTEGELQQISSTGVMAHGDVALGVEERQLHPPQLVVVIGILLTPAVIRHSTFPSQQVLHWDVQGPWG